MGQAFMNLKDYFSAIGVFKKSLEINSMDYRAYYYLGKCYYILVFCFLANEEIHLNCYDDQSKNHVRNLLVFDY